MTLDKGSPLQQLQSSHRSRNWANEYIHRDRGLREGLYRSDNEKYFKLERLSETDIERLLAKRNQSLLPDSKIEWIKKNDARQLIWTQTALTEKTGIMPYLTGDSIHSEDRLEAVLLMLDVWNAPLPEKEDFVYAIKDEWARRHLKETQLSWLDSKNHVQLDWMMNYLEKHNRKLPSTVAEPASPKEQYEYILACLDQTTLLDEAVHKLFFINLRKSWSQYKYRNSGKAKKPLYLFIEEEAKKQLDELAKRQKRSKHDIVEEWIRKAADNDDPPV
ncbi:MAG: ribbon-helix-helix domain-containing protein [Pseudomonadales bacterium]|nr:ribbon-helix-helix domain-containing protein [Pseudomonadales bacterium]